MRVVPKVAEFEPPTSQEFRAYVDAVADAVGAGPDERYCRTDEVYAAYIVVPRMDRRFPGREVALMWDSGGWALGFETSSGEDMIILGSTSGRPVPAPSAVVALCDDLLPTPRT